MFNLIFAIIGMIVFLVFGFKALADFGIGFNWKVIFPAFDFSKKTNNDHNFDNLAVSLIEPVDPIKVKKLEPILIKLTYYAPALTQEDECDENGICKGEYVLIGENSDTIRIDSPKCTEFNPEISRYDSGPYDPETGTYKKIIFDWQGNEIRKCGWFDFPKSRIISRQNSSFITSIKKQILNYDTIDEFGSKIVK